MTSTAQGPTLPGLSSTEGFPAKTYPWQALAAAWVKAHDPGSTGRSSGSWMTSAPAGSFSRTSLDSCHPTEGGIWVPSSGPWANSGMGTPGECWTLNTSEYPSDAVESSLSDILEPHGVHLRRYFLSPKAAAGILRRSVARGRALPAPLRVALEAVASRVPCPDITDG